MPVSQTCLICGDDISGRCGPAKYCSLCGYCARKVRIVNSSSRLKQGERCQVCNAKLMPSDGNILCSNQECFFAAVRKYDEIHGGRARRQAAKQAARQVGLAAIIDARSPEKLIKAIERLIAQVHGG